MKNGAARAIRRTLTAWLLSAAMLLVSFAPLSASAATRISPEAHFTPGQATLTELRAFFQNGAYWNHVSGTEDTPYSVTDTPCSPYTGSDGLHLDEGVVCNYFEVPGKVWGGWQCCGFLRLMTYLYFGVSFENWETSTSLSGMKAGDVLYLTSGGPHYIWVLSVTDNADGTKRITYNDCNGAGRRVHCQIQWDARCTADPATGELELAAIGAWDVFKRYVAPGGARTVLPDSNTEAPTPTPVGYTVAYADGQGKTGPRTAVSGDLTLKDCTYRRPGYTFAGWTLQRASDEAWLCGDAWSVGASADRATRFSPGDKLPASLFAGMAGETYDAVAAWTVNRLTVRYAPNGGQLTDAAYRADEQSGVILRADTGKPLQDEWVYGAVSGDLPDAEAWGLMKPGYTFVGWSLAPHYKNTQTAPDVAARLKSKSGEETWYAVWVPNMVEIWYRTDGGTVAAPDYQLLSNGRICGGDQASWPLTRLFYNGNASLLTARELGLTRDGCAFAGWTTNGKTPVTDASVRRMAVGSFRTRVELTALWTEDRSSSKGDGKP